MLPDNLPTQRAVGRYWLVDKHLLHGVTWLRKVGYTWLCNFSNSIPVEMTIIQLRRQELAAAVAAEGLRPILAPDTPRELAALLEAAWQLQPASRPAAAHLEAELRALLGRTEAAPAASLRADATVANGNSHAPHADGVFPVLTFCLYMLLYR